MEITEVREGNVPENEPAPVVHQQPAQTIEEPEEVVQEEAQVDYQALYEAEKAKVAKAEFTLYKQKKEEKKLRTEQVQAQGYSDPAEIDRIVEEKTQQLFEAQRQKESEDVLEEELMRLTSNEDERRLIRFKYDNSIRQTGYSRLAIRQDLEDAQFLANKTKYQKEKGELAQAAISKRTMSNTGVGVSQERPQATEDLSKQFNAADWAFMQKRKWTPAQIKSALAAKSQ